MLQKREYVKCQECNCVMEGILTHEVRRICEPCLCDVQRTETQEPEQ